MMVSLEEGTLSTSEECKTPNCHRPGIISTCHRSCHEAVDVSRDAYLFS